MSDQRETYQRISVPEAARHYGVSVATVRRRIRDGTYLAERVHRPQGAAYVVLIASDQASDHERLASDQQVGTTARLNRSADDQAAAIAALVQATIRETLTPIISPLLAANERQAETIREQAQAIGTLTARLEAATAPKSPQEGRTATLGGFVALHTRSVLVVALLAAVIAVVALLWLR